MTVAELEALVASVVDQARPSEQVEAFASSGTRINVKVYDGDVEDLTRAGTAGIGIRVISDHRTGFAWAGSLDDDLVRSALAEARDNAEFAEPDEWAALAEPDGVAEPDVDLWRDGLDDRTTDEKVQVALDLERATVARDPRVTKVLSATYADAAAQSALASTTGVRASARATLAYLSVGALARDGDETTTGGGVSIGREPTGLSIDEAASDAVERATRLLGAKKPASQKVTLVLEPRMTATLLGIVGGMLNGERVLKGRTPFAERVGDEIASPLFNLVDDPTDPRSLSADRHDGEGLATRRIPLVTAGRLDGFLHNSYTARRASTASTASAVRSYSSTPSVGAQALAVAPGEGSFDDLVAGVANGLVVQTMKGLHSGVNAVSGDFSVGIEGLMVRNGEVAEPVKEATIASTIQRMLLEMSHVGADLEWTPGGTGGVTLVIPDVSLSGT